MTDPDLVHQLKTLADLRASGVITEEEFARAKARVLGSTTAGGPVPAPTPAPPPVENPSLDVPTTVVTRSGTAAEAPSAGEPPWWHAFDTHEQPKPPEPATSPSPGLPMPTARPREGGSRPTAVYVLTGAGLAALLAFFAMPLAYAPLVGSLTGAQVASLSSQVGALGLLWIVPLSAVAVAGIGAWMSLAPMIPPAQRRAGLISVVIAAGVSILIYVIAFVGVQSQLAETGAARRGISATSLTGIGFWLAVLCMIVAVVAAAREMSSSKS